MRTRILASALLFLLVTVVSAPWLQSEADQGVPHFNAAPGAQASAHPDYGSALRQERAVSLSDTCL